MLPVLVAAGFLATWLPVEQWTHGFPQLSKSAYAQGIGSPGRSWIDRAVGRDAHVAAIWSGGNNLALWENEFWNRSIDRVYGLGARLPGDMPETQVSVEQATGIIRGVTERYVLASTSLELAGRRIASDPEKQLVLYQVTPPARITTQIIGLYPTKPGVLPWSRGHVHWIRSDCRGGELSVRVSSDPSTFRDTRQTLTVGGTTPARTIRLVPTTDNRRLVFPLIPAHGVCRVDMTISPTRIPARIPRLHSSDTRPLGLHFELPFRYSPPR
jgi:hypothetical protein